MKHLPIQFISSMALALVAALFFFVPTAFGIDIGLDIVSNAGTAAGYEEATETSFAQTLGTVVRTAISFLGIIFTILVVYAGILWMTARGDEGQVEKAQKILRNAVIGLILAVASYSISNFVVSGFVTSGR